MFLHAREGHVELGRLDVSLLPVAAPSHAWLHTEPCVQCIPRFVGHDAALEQLGD